MNPSFQGTYRVSYLQLSILRVQRLFKRTAQRIILNRGTCLLSALPSPAKAAAAVVGGALFVGAVPVALGAMGFTGAGIAASSLAAKMMSSAAIANGGGVAAGSLVATLQSVGAAGLSTSSNIILGSAGSALGAWLWDRKKKAPSSPPPESSTEAERGSCAGDDPPGPQDVSPPNDKSSASQNSSKKHRK
ncbi:interferon alpha-inducible protein 27-like protein 2 isoform X4 [Balaenoptera acutorostrata]|uniref:Interferon alpha-inducible protein 27-like protein 2 isoform X4 n=1 Tax=Balaenoptera acutorostrata TaxID=9767 RepID=A0ABM3T9E1_BALAC|nr:interferon alpha-inducible protein 27-like protein 2 isoform X4 [Balaenoptera acutorostrata]